MSETGRVSSASTSSGTSSTAAQTGEPDGPNSPAVRTAAPGQVCAGCGQTGASVDDEGVWFHEDCGFKPAPARGTPMSGGRVLSPCDHGSWSGDEGPVADLGRMPTRWKCDGCGVVRDERPVCLSCARDHFPGVPLSQTWPHDARTCCSCGMTTEMGYQLPLAFMPVEAAS